MNALITIIAIILFLVLGIIIYNGLNGMDKVIIFLVEIIACLIFTITLFNISSIGVDYPSEQNKKIAMKTLVAIFTPINGILLLPNITRIINESKNGEIGKDECNKKIKKFLSIFVLVLIIEFIYLRNTQIGI